MQDPPVQRDLRSFTGQGYDKGAPRLVQALWFAVSHLVVQRWWCPAKVRVIILRKFGARIGSDVLIRQRVRIHWPWKLAVGDAVWIGEGAWVLNLEPVTIGSNVCISQEALLCTGSHLRSSPTLEFDNGPIRVDDGAWIAARATVLRGVTVGSGATVGAGAVVSIDVSPHSVVMGAHAKGTS